MTVFKFTWKEISGLLVLLRKFYRLLPHPPQKIQITMDLQFFEHLREIKVCLCQIIITGVYGLNSLVTSKSTFQIIVK